MLNVGAKGEEKERAKEVFNLTLFLLLFVNQKLIQALL